MRSFLKRIGVSFTVLALATAMLPAAALAEALDCYIAEMEQEEEILEIVEEIEDSIDDDDFDEAEIDAVEEIESVSEIADELEDVHGIDVVSADEGSVSISEAVHDVFASAEKRGSTQNLIGDDNETYKFDARNKANVAKEIYGEIKKYPSSTKL